MLAQVCFSFFLKVVEVSKTGKKREGEVYFSGVSSTRWSSSQLTHALTQRYWPSCCGMAKKGEGEKEEETKLKPKKEYKRLSEADVSSYKSLLSPICSVPVLEGSLPRVRERCNRRVWVSTNRYLPVDLGTCLDPHLL